MSRIHFVPADNTKAVRNLQRKLASLDPDGKQDLLRLQANPYSGKYDDATLAAIMAFKEMNFITPADGICDEHTWRLIDEQAGSTFAETWQFEIDALTNDSPPQQVQPMRATLAQEANACQLAGLALSGGGIRSATFSLGVLQALGEQKMLRKFHYLSTVSGGGYIGAWFSKWLKDLGGDIKEIECQLTPGAPGRPVEREPEQIKFLRQYSNYLTPKKGLFSADTWALLGTYVRNTMLNMTILVALLAAVLVVPRLLAVYVNYGIALAPIEVSALGWILRFTPFTGAAVIAALWAVFWIAASVSTLPDPGKTRHLWGQSQASIIWFIVVPLMLAAFFGSSALWAYRADIGAAWSALLTTPGFDNPIAFWLYAPGLAYFIAWAAGWGLAKYHNRKSLAIRGQAAPSFSWKETWVEAVGHLVCAVVALAVGAVLVILATKALNAWHMAYRAPAESTIAVVAFGMPVLLTLFGVTMALSVGLVGRLYTDKSREWWARQSGWTTIFVIAWLALATVGLYAPYGVQELGAWTRGMLSSVWLATIWSVVKIGRGSATGAPDPKTRLKWLARLAPLVFSIGAVCLVSTLVLYLVPVPAELRGAVGAVALNDRVAFLFNPARNSAGTLFLVMFCCLAAGLSLAWRVDINKFSLHMMYRNRLVRAYLGASNRRRQAHPFTGFDPTDDIHLDELLATGTMLQRPYHIVNTALNLVHGNELAWQTRKAANFTFTPAYCGFELPAMAAPGVPTLAHQTRRGGFRRTGAYRPIQARRDDEERGINLGMAMAVSGAAASPSMGYHSSPSLAFLMTLFNVRLGRWFVNPTRPVPRRDGNRLLAPPPPRTSPRVGILHLISELFGLTDADSDYVYLSDGGHFENLGVYELVRRRCRLIVAVDASADRELGFGDLGNLIRKCGTDLHIEIEIKVGQIDLQQQAEFSRAHCVTGKIRYDKVDDGGKPGTLLYIKPSLLGTEFAEILNYRKANKGFPHQSTADAWFDETQFEAYRSLGYQIGKEALEQAIADVARNRLKGQDIEALCEALHAIWGRADEEATAAHANGRLLKLVHYRGLTQRRKAGAQISANDHRVQDRRQS
jgi:predicted acylesterase/phospholipase RssA